MASYIKHQESQIKSISYDTHEQRVGERTGGIVP